jgi:hypothetical protein
MTGRADPAELELLRSSMRNRELIEQLSTENQSATELIAVIEMRVQKCHAKARRRKSLRERFEDPESWGTLLGVVFITIPLSVALIHAVITAIRDLIVGR